MWNGFRGTRWLRCARRVGGTAPADQLLGGGRHAGRYPGPEWRGGDTFGHPDSGERGRGDWSGMSIRVLIAEDQKMVLGALAALLDIERDIEVVGQARNGEEALSLIASAKPDIVL